MQPRCTIVCCCSPTEQAYSTDMPPFAAVTRPSKLIAPMYHSLLLQPDWASL